MSSSSRTQPRTGKQTLSKTSAQWLEAREARLNPPMDDDEAIFDPFADLAEANAEQVTKLRMMFDWQPRPELMH